MSTQYAKALTEGGNWWKSSKEGKYISPIYFGCTRASSGLSEFFYPDSCMLPLIDHDASEAMLINLGKTLDQYFWNLKADKSLLCLNLLSRKLRRSGILSVPRVIPSGQMTTTKTPFPLMMRAIGSQQLLL